MPDEENVAEENVTEENEEEAAVAPEESEVVDASADVESESDSGSSVDEYSTGHGWYEISGEKYHGKVAANVALDAEEEAAETTTSFASSQDAIQATFVAGAQALADRKKAERAERLAEDQPPRRKPQFVR